MKAAESRRLFLGVGLSLVLLFLLGNWTLQAAEGDPVFWMDSSRVESMSLPDFAPESWRADIQKVFQGFPVTSIRHPKLVPAVRHALQSLSFIREVREVERRFPRSLGVRLTFRRPVARIQLGSNEFVVDEEAVLLRGVFSGSLPLLAAYPDDVFGMPAGYGKKWDNEAVHEGLSVLEEVEGFYRPLGVTRIDLSNLGGRQDPFASEISLVTARGATIAWGRSAARDSFGELPVETKRKNWIRVLRKYPGLRGVREVDLRFDRPTVVLQDE